MMEQKLTRREKIDITIILAVFLATILLYFSGFEGWYVPTIAYVVILVFLAIVQLLIILWAKWIYRKNRGWFPADDARKKRKQRNKK